MEVHVCTVDNKRECSNILMLNCFGCAIPKFCRCLRPEARARVAAIWGEFLEDGNISIGVFDK